MTQPTTLADATRLAQEIEHHLNQVLIGQRQVVREVLQRQHLLAKSARPWPSTAVPAPRSI